MLSYTERYLKGVMAKRSFLCVGIDLEHNHVPPIFGRRGLPAMERYYREVIDLAAKKVAVVKPQYAYYGALGPNFIKMLIRLVEYAHSKGLLVILDAKRGDIGKTMEMYGQEVFGQYGVDACTVVPYLGPVYMVWMEWFEKGRMAIPMILTSNPEANWLQTKRLESGLYVFELAAESAKENNAIVAERTNGIGQIGGVVGATFPEQAISCRQHAGDDVTFLIPGYGAQGGDANGAVKGLLNSRGQIMGTVNNSRGITLSWFDRKEGVPRKGDPMELVAKAIDAANNDLNLALRIELGGKDPYSSNFDIYSSG